MTLPTRAPGPHRAVLDDPHDVADAARRLAEGVLVAHGFANIYAITTLPDLGTVRRVNLLKGRPTDQTGSITGPPPGLPDVWDLDALPEGLSRRTVLDLWDRLLSLGPFGFRGPAAADVPDHLTGRDGLSRTAQVISPGYACPSNLFLDRARRSAGVHLLHVTSANRSRHLSGLVDEPVHWRADALRAELDDLTGCRPEVHLLEHRDESAVRRSHPRHRPVSTSILGVHTTVRVPGDDRPHLVLERQGSFAAEDVRSVLAEVGLGMVLGPGGRTPLQPRDYDGTSLRTIQEPEEGQHVVGGAAGGSRGVAAEVQPGPVGPARLHGVDRGAHHVLGRAAQLPQ